MEFKVMNLEETKGCYEKYHSMHLHEFLLEGTLPEHVQAMTALDKADYLFERIQAFNRNQLNTKCILNCSSTRSKHDLIYPTSTKEKGPIVTTVVYETVLLRFIQVGQLIPDVVPIEQLIQTLAFENPTLQSRQQRFEKETETLAIYDWLELFLNQTFVHQQSWNLNGDDDFKGFKVLLKQNENLLNQLGITFELFEVRQTSELFGMCETDDYTQGLAFHHPFLPKTYYFKGMYWRDLANPDSPCTQARRCSDDEWFKIRREHQKNLEQALQLLNGTKDFKSLQQFR